MPLLGATVNRGLQGNSSHNRKAKGKVRVNLSICKYHILRDVVSSLGYEVVEEPDTPTEATMPDWDLCWMDTSVTVDRVNRLKGYQRLNHFPGMLEICRKVSLARNMARMSRYLPAQYNFFPQSWSIPSQVDEFVQTLRRRGQGQRMATYIVKPSSGAMGRGIHLVQTEADLLQNEMTDSVAQQYIKNPLLIDGYKFDLRIYVLVRSVDPLEVFIYKEGLARLATTPYEHPLPSNIHKRNMHLTNYAVNKDSEHFDRSSGTNSGSKRLLTAVMQELHERGVDTELLWEDIQMCIAKTILSVQPHLAHTYHTAVRQSSKDAVGEDVASLCFEVLGFDVLLDEDLQPWVLEVNHSPSLTCDSAMDSELKHAVLADTILSLDLSPEHREQHYAHQKVAQSERLYAASRSRGSPNWQAMRPSSISGRRDRLRAAATALEAEAGLPGRSKSTISSSTPHIDESIQHYRTWGFSAPKEKRGVSMGQYQPLYPHPDAARQAELENMLQVAARIYPPQGCVCTFCRKQQAIVGNGATAMEALRGSSNPRMTPRGERRGERQCSGRSRTSYQASHCEEAGNEDERLERCSSGGSSTSSSGSLEGGGEPQLLATNGRAERTNGRHRLVSRPLVQSSSVPPSDTASHSTSYRARQQASYDSLSRHFENYAQHRNSGPNTSQPATPRTELRSTNLADLAKKNSIRALHTSRNLRSPPDSALSSQKAKARTTVASMSTASSRAKSARRTAFLSTNVREGDHTATEGGVVIPSCRANAARARTGRSCSNPYANQYAALVSEMMEFSHVSPSSCGRSDPVRIAEG